MEVQNENGRIKVEASYDEMANIIYALDMFNATNDNQTTKDLAFQLHNPMVVKK
ncbi:hypothetical protein GCM10008983_06650 [Lentibacillus halophilus]|uniref:YD repeat-containing protein n=1 Tax=Lentibacillus halophilus TaxID=295065 RepID=A0ABN0Z4Q9_9BACI